MSIEPQGGERSDIQAGIIAAAAENISRSGSNRVKPTDLIPKWHKVVRRQTAEEMQCILRTHLRV